MKKKVLGFSLRHPPLRAGPVTSACHSPDGSGDPADSQHSKNLPGVGNNAFVQNHGHGKQNQKIGKAC